MSSAILLPSRKYETSFAETLSHSSLSSERGKLEFLCSESLAASKSGHRFTLHGLTNESVVKNLLILGKQREKLEDRTEGYSARMKDFTTIAADVSSFAIWISPMQQQVRLDVVKIF